MAPASSGSTMLGSWARKRVAGTGAPSTAEPPAFKASTAAWSVSSLTIT